MKIVEVHGETILNSYPQTDCLLNSFFAEEVAWFTSFANSPYNFFQAMRDEISLAGMELHLKKRKKGEGVSPKQRLAE